MVTIGNRGRRKANGGEGRGGWVGGEKRIDAFILF